MTVQSIGAAAATVTKNRGVPVLGSASATSIRSALDAMATAVGADAAASRASVFSLDDLRSAPSSGAASAVSATQTLTVDGVPLVMELQEVPSGVLAANLVVGSATPDAMGTMVLCNGDLTVPAGVGVFPAATKRGLYLVVRGNLVVSGQITMTKYGPAGNTPGQRVRIDGTVDVPAAGAAGGIGKNNPTQATTTGNGGDGVSGVSLLGSGGGGGGLFRDGLSSSCYAGNGGKGTSFAGGAGGASLHQPGASGRNGGNANDTGQGGDTAVGFNQGGMDSAIGNLAGKKNDGTRNPTYTGLAGLLVIVVTGNITINSGGLINSDGVSATVDNFNGGAGGGGIVHVMYGGSLTNNGTIRANGGASPVGSFERPGAGGAGYVRTAVKGTG